MNNLPAEKNRRILVIDDNRAIHDDFRKILSPGTIAAAALDATETALFGKSKNVVRQISYEIDSAYQGQEGVMLVKQALEAGRPYAMAFVDIRMPPGWDGVETTQKIWAVDSEIQIVLCTAYADYSWDEMFEKIGNSDGLVILKKPFDIVEALQLAHALTEKWWLHQQSRRKMEELENLVAVRTGELLWKTAFLEAQVNSSIDGILVVNQQKQKSLQNQRFVNLLKIPKHIADNNDDEQQLQWVANITNNPGQFVETVVYLNSHPDEISRDEIELKDGTILDRYSSPVVGQDGKYYGRIWTFRDITERKRAEKSAQENGERYRHEQARLRALIDSIPDLIFFKNRESVFLGCNKAFEVHSGVQENEIIGKTDLELLPREQAESFRQKDREMLASGKAVRIEEWIPSPNGGGGLFETLKTPYNDSNGEQLGLIGVSRDITERKKAENALRESDEKFHQLADNITDVFWIRSPDMSEVHYVSPAFEQIWGRPVASLYAHPQQWADFILAEDRERVLGVFAALTGDSKSLDIEYRIVRPNGDIRWIRARGFQVRDAADQLIRHAGIVTDITERKRTDEIVNRLAAIVENSNEAIISKTLDGIITSWNPAAEKMFGYTESEIIGQPLQMLIPPDHPNAEAEILLRGQLVQRFETVRIRKGGQRFDASVTISPIKDIDGKVVGISKIVRDITERKRLEAQLFQSQKMETVGKLAGGFAHEFNSILTAIIGQSELLVSDLPSGSPLAQNATEISKAAGRAAKLIRQLLAYGRKQFLQPEILNLNRVIASMEDVFRHLMGNNVDTQIVPALDLHAMKADAGQIEQVIMNLVINARDAMPNGGKLTLETANVSFDQDSVGRYPELKPGDYVMLAITDTGTGMSAKVKAHMFEPFFSTKGVGQGTGLGLSTCYGIVKQSGGHISVYSEPGRGTTFKVYLPQIEPEAKIPILRLDSPGLPRGTETILLVEDDPALREMAVTLLRRLGYTVLAAANGVEALSVKHQRSTGHIDLLFTDVVMPHMSGKELADRVRALYPLTKILFTSAYTENAIVHQGVLDKGVALLQKPFTPSALAHKLREVLDQPGAPKPDNVQKTFGFTNLSGEVKTPTI